MLSRWGFYFWHVFSSRYYQLANLNKNIMAKFKIRRKMNNRIVADVCSAIASTMNIDPIWIRLTVVVAGLLVFPWVFLVYIISAIIIPMDDSENHVIEEYKKVYRVKEGKKLGGVCTGLEKYFDIDVVAIRLGFVLSTFMGFGLLIYLILWMITPVYKPTISA